MAKSRQWQGIPTNVSLAQFEQFVGPHLRMGRRGPAPKLSSHAICNYILRLLYLGCLWKELPIGKDRQGRPEIHYTRIYRAFRRWQADGCLDAIFEGSVFRLHPDDRLDTSILHGDRTTTPVHKGGHNPRLSPDGVYDCRPTRKAIFKRGMVPNINPNARGRKRPRRGRKPLFDTPIFEERFNTIERVFGWEDKFRRLLLRFDRISQLHYAFKTLAYTMINLRHHCRS